jgi:hypothetical protein
VLLFQLAVEQLGGNTTELAVRQIFKTLVTENEGKRCSQATALISGAAM